MYRHGKNNISFNGINDWVQAFKRFRLFKLVL